MAAQCPRSALHTTVSMPTAMAADFAPAMATCDCENYMAREPSRPSCFCSGGVMLHILLVISLTMAIASAAIAVIITQEITELKEIHRTYQLQRDQELLETVGYNGANSGPLAQPLMAPPPLPGNTNEFCVPCGELSSEADDTSMVTTHFELTGEGNQVQRVCCVNRFNATQLAALMKSVSRFCNFLYLKIHWSRGKIVAISQTTFSNAFSWMKMYEFRLRFHWNLFLRLELTIFQHWFR